MDAIDAEHDLAIFSAELDRTVEKFQAVLTLAQKLCDQGLDESKLRLNELQEVAQELEQAKAAVEAERSKRLKKEA